MDFQSLVEQIHNKLLQTFSRKKIVARTCKWNFKFFSENYFRQQNFLLLLVDWFKNSFTCKWSDNCWSSKIVEEFVYFGTNWCLFRN